MIIAIIAGGSGTRLWPLSTPEYPKHLLKINGDDLSLLQNTFERAKLLTSTDKIYVVTEQSHLHHVREQLSELPEEAFICEPGRRGTANCIMAALAHIASRHDADEPIASIHADHYIRDVSGFVYSLHLAANTAHNEKRIVLVGVEPTYPATGFGYIEKGDVLNEANFVFNVRSFKEKPDHNTAQEYFRSGNYLWNCGYFVASLNTFRHNLQSHAPQLYENYERLTQANEDSYQDTYMSFESEPIDTALIEKVPDLLVVPANFDWMDLGSFGDLHTAVGGNEAGNHTHGHVELEEVQNSLVHNHEDKPVAVIGLDNVVVVNTPHGILVARKDQAQKVGDVSKRLKKD
ncbi:MAG TPA: mannose-1-phosphate guanylyltransferase [Candidatus Saccharimonadales bacterium]|nr:mannose-1-phosphate guanylyltransferase [Candidatus Saccharimonadales bacterium]